MITPADIVSTARGYLGTRYRHLGRVKGVGVDCLGLSLCVGHDLDLPGIAQAWQDERLRVYSRSPDGRKLLKVCDEYLVRTSCPGLGDLLVMAFAGNPQHFAIVSRVSPLYDTPTYLIHAYDLVAEVVENGINVAKAKLVRAYRFPGVE